MAKLLALAVIASVVCFASSHYHAVPDVNKLTTGVSVGHGDRVRRQNRDNIRIVPVFDTSVDTMLPAAKANMLRTDTVPRIIEFLANSLMVDQLQQPLMFDSDCTDNMIYRTTNIGGRGCVTTCTPTTVCGEVNIPNQHIRCIQCDGGDSNSCTMTSSGGGVNNADVVLYISAIDTNCPSAEQNGAQTVAFASACQMEATTDRPIAGNINFCPLGVTGNAADYVFELGIHESMHALAFSSSLFAFWRDGNGDPRTPRNPLSGLPENIDTIRGIYMPSTETIRSVSFSTWNTINGLVPHSVNQLITPAVVREARLHFDCPNLAGVELENQGSPGTEFSHWEKRILGNEAMTGELTFNPVFSRITLAAFEDSGWYDVNYELAQPLAWGRGAGCDFLTGSCYNWITSQNLQSRPTSPHCVDTSGRRGCTVDYEAIGRCAIVQLNQPLPNDYQYFTDPNQGGSVEIADFCPFFNSFNIVSDGVIRGSECSDVGNTPTNNAIAESYGSGSRCIRHGSRAWTNERFIGIPIGAGCYQYTCSADTGVSVIIAGLSYQCTCEGEEIRFGFTDSSGTDFTGSVICPSCSQLCYDTLTNCPASETQCPGRITTIEGATIQPTLPGDSGATTTSSLGTAVVTIATIVMALF